MKRRSFLKTAGAAMALPPWLHAQTAFGWIDLTNCVVVNPAPEAAVAVQVLIEEAEKRCGIRWQTAVPGVPIFGATIHAFTRKSAGRAEPKLAAALHASQTLSAEGFVIRSGQDASGTWIAVVGADDRGLLFGVGQLLRLIQFDPQRATVAPDRLSITTQPKYSLRGHQLGYRPKTNSYDGWTVAMWDQYIRDLALFGTNAIELVPPRSDDARTSPLFPLPPEKMMVEMSRIADHYGLDVWIWYPALDKDYSNPTTVDFSLAEWGRIFDSLPRVDAVFVPGGDPGSTPPQYLFPLLEKQKANLHRHHPKVQMWVSSQGFDAEHTDEFLSLLRQDGTKRWLDGVVFGPMSRLSIEELRRAVPSNYPIRCYPDITHSVWCQYPVPNWDVAYALTQGREVINPRPIGQAAILQHILPHSIGFLSYSEGCNDDVNKFVWSSLSWDPDRDVTEVLGEFANHFIGWRQAEAFGQGLLDLESNWSGPLSANAKVEITLERFRDMERTCAPAVLTNWRFQQALFRAYFDAFIRRRLLEETASVQKAREQLERILEIGWAPVTMGASPPAKDSISNGFDPDILLVSAKQILEESATQPAGRVLRQRIAELGEALFQSIRMQLAVERYQGEAVRRGANLDTLDHPVSDLMWMRREILEIGKLSDPSSKLTAIRGLLFRTDPGPDGFYDELGNPANRPHLLNAEINPRDPDFRITPVVDSMYPDTLQDTAPIAWKHWVQSLYGSSIQLRYPRLDPEAEYRLRVVYAGDEPKEKIHLMANDTIEVHPPLLRTWPPTPQEFPIAKEATASGELTLTWNGERGGGDGRGCQIAEVWLLCTRPTPR